MSAFRHSREILAKPEAVFEAFRDPARLARWWGPDGFSNSFHTFEFRPGGQWRFTMHGQDGSNYENQAVFQEIKPNTFVLIRHTSKPNFNLSITLSPSALGTLVSWVQEFDDSSIAANVRPIVEPANEQNLNRLAAEVSKARA